MKNTADESLRDTGQRSRDTETFATFLAAAGGEHVARRGTLTLSAAVFHARTSAMPVKALDLPESEVGFGPSSAGSFAFFCRSSYLWKTFQLSLAGAWIAFSATWPNAGMTRNGFAFRLAPLVRRTRETGCSLWDGDAGLLPTMTASLADKKGADYARRKRAGGGRGPDLQTFATMYPLPTLTANMGERGGRGDLHGQSNKHMGRRLASLNARDHRSPNVNGNFEDQLPNQIGGQLNPTWCEWYQGFPFGWTELERLETS